MTATRGDRGPGATRQPIFVSTVRHERRPASLIGLAAVALIAVAAVLGLAGAPALLWVPAAIAAGVALGLWRRSRRSRTQTK